MVRSELLLLLILVLCLLALPAFSGDVAEPAVQAESSESASEVFIAPAIPSGVGSCGADFGCDVTDLGSPDSQLFDHDALLEELAASLGTE